MWKRARWATVQGCLLAACLGSLSAQEPASVTTLTSDGVTIHGQPYFGSLDDESPLILLFHQGGSNGRGEYGELAPWLNAAGFRALTWDLRVGGDIHGSENRTIAGLAPNVARTFCDAYADMAAALEYVKSRNLGSRVVLWGSSYTAALVFRLAAENRGNVVALLAFSPPAGGSLVDCRPREWVDQIAAPVGVFRPRVEMGFDSIEEQREILVNAGADFFIVEEGVHGSSMLVDARTGNDMSAARRLVIQWLAEAVGNAHQ